MEILRLLLVSACLLIPPAPADGNEGACVLAYFRQRYPTRVEIDAKGKIHDIPLAEPMAVEKLHFAVSDDGRHWTPLHGNEPVWDQRLRDPFIRKAPDGLWHLMATGRAAGDPRRGQGPVCLHAVSRDLVSWDLVESLPLMKGVKDASGRPARNIWAPEWFYDERSGDYLLLWSSSFEDAGWKDSRLWCSRTRDWETFSPARVLFDPDYSAIDGSLLEHAGKYYLYHKEEEFGERTGERRAIRLATADRPEGPYAVHEGPLNDGQIVPTITEGCSIMADPTQPGWLLLYDYCMTNRFGASFSRNLVDWSVIEDVGFPPDARHGSVFHVDGDQLAKLRSAFSKPRPQGNGPSAGGSDR
ncbi:glycoside hydrolase family 43 protein [Haloferula sargassicola]|uniref:1,4-beta-xylanase n=1 Tax=Haloferula sargassicola TaxID=490096 RepID=A0ABP9URC4_9BACT